MTCFNRRAKTLACLRSLREATPARELEVEVFLVDDGSTDGTREAAAACFPAARVLQGGNLFWTRGIHLAFSTAMRERHDFYLWLNDDCVLHADALARLLRTYHELVSRVGAAVIVVGSVCDATNGRVSYGGLCRPVWWKRTRVEVVVPGGKPIECDTMNGNCVLIPQAVAERVGNLDPTFEHAMGDLDYGLRARALGVRIIVAPGFVGTCSRNPIQETFEDTALPLVRRWRLINARKGLPARSWLHYTRRHAGPLWLVFFFWPYVRVVLSSVAHGRVIR